MPIIRQKVITRADVQAHPERLYVFGDNMARRGLGGQAAAMRGEPNAVGIPTKWEPDNRPESFFTDDDYNDPLVRRAVDAALRTVGDALEKDRMVVVPADGVGTGLADLPRRSPRIYDYVRYALDGFEGAYRGGSK